MTNEIAEMQQTLYYPFGGIIADLSTGRSVQNKLYNGQGSCKREQSCSHELPSVAEAQPKVKELATSKNLRPRLGQEGACRKTHDYWYF